MCIIIFNYLFILLIIFEPMRSFLQYRLRCTILSQEPEEVDFRSVRLSTSQPEEKGIAALMPPSNTHITQPPPPVEDYQVGRYIFCELGICAWCLLACAGAILFAAEAQKKQFEGGFQRRIRIQTGSDKILRMWEICFITWGAGCILATFHV